MNLASRASMALPTAVNRPLILSLMTNIFLRTAIVRQHFKSSRRKSRGPGPGVLWPSSTSRPIYRYLYYETGNIPLAYYFGGVLHAEGIHMVKIERAVVSVSDKEGIIDFCKALSHMGVEIISTGGTAKLLTSNGLKVIGISEYTGFPEMLDGRVKTLHPAIFAGLLARRDPPEHMGQLRGGRTEAIDMVVVNLYPFKQTVLKDGRPGRDHREHRHRRTVHDPGRGQELRVRGRGDRPSPGTPSILEEMEVNGGTIAIATLKLAHAGGVPHHRLLRLHDRPAHLGGVFPATQFPATLTIGLEKCQDLRYGENPEQTAAFYVDPFAKGVCVSRTEKLHGKELSYNNILDLESALELLREFDRPTVVVIKHTNPCGIASADTISDAFVIAYNVDPLAAFGCVIGLNRNVDLATATEISGISSIASSPRTSTRRRWNCCRRRRTSGC